MKHTTRQALEINGVYSDKIISFDYLCQASNWAKQSGYSTTENVTRPLNLTFPAIGTARKLRETASLLSGSDNVKIDDLDVMLNCTTYPVRVTYSAREDRDIFFVKNANPKRYFGLILYNLLFTSQKLTFLASEGGLVVQEAPGQVLEDVLDNPYEKGSLFNDDEYFKELATLEVFLNFAGIGDIVGKERNVTVDNDHHLHVIDFDNSFDEEYIYDFPARIRNNRHLNGRLKKHAFRRIRRAASRNLAYLLPLLEAIKEEKLGQDFAWYRGADDYKEYILRELIRDN